MKKTLIVLTAVLVTVLLGTLFFTRYYITGERVTNYANEIIGEEYTVGIGDADFNLFSRSLELSDISVDAGGEQLLLFEAETIRFEGIGFIQAIRGNISIKKVLVRDFFLDQTAYPGGEQNNGGDTGSDVAELWLGESNLQNGKVRFGAGEDAEGELLGLHVQIGPVKTRVGCPDCSDAPGIGDIEITIAEVDVAFWENRYRANMETITISETEKKIELETAKLRSTQSVGDYFDALEYRTDHFSVDLSGLRIQNPDFSVMKEMEGFVAASVSLDSLDLHVTLDKRVPEEPQKDIKPMPQEALANLPFRLYTDSLSVHHADIRYSEIDEDGERPGTITFAATHARVAPLSSDLSGPIVATAESYLEGHGKLAAEFRFLLENGAPITRISGSLGRFDVTLLNNIFEDLEGIRIKEGMLHRADFDYTMAGEKAEGFFMVHYEDLSLERIDRADHSQGFRERLSGLLMDKIVIRENSRRNDEDFRRGEVDQELDRHSGFFNNVWKSLRSGIMDAISRI